MNKIEQLLGTNWSYHTPVHNHTLSSQWSTLIMTFLYPGDTLNLGPCSKNI